MSQLEKEIQKLKQVISQHKTCKIIKDGKRSSNFIKSGNSLTRVSSGRAPTVSKRVKRVGIKSKNKSLVKDKSGNLYSIGKNTLKKKKYCQYYRFGKCSKRKCRDIHDSSRRSPCPKYLQGLECENCTLNHLLTPFITPNCKFYLMGNCTKKGCRFLHLKKDGGEICPDFADNGYCSLGGKCSNLHVFSCPRFQKDGKCTKKGCKLKHSLPLAGDQEMPIMPDFESLEESDSDTSVEEMSAQVSEEEESELEIFQD